MRTRKATSLVLGATAILLIGWDIYVAGNRMPGDTISELLLDFSIKHPIIPFILGVLVGHLFWPQKRI